MAQSDARSIRIISDFLFFIWNYFSFWIWYLMLWRILWDLIVEWLELFILMSKKPYYNSGSCNGEGNTIWTRILWLENVFSCLAVIPSTLTWWRLRFSGKFRWWNLRFVQFIFFFPLSLFFYPVLHHRGAKNIHQYVIHLRKTEFLVGEYIRSIIKMGSDFVV